MNESTCKATKPACKIARVYIQLKTRSLDRPFDYLAPERMKGRFGTGSMVLVPFGRQKALGLVGEIVPASDVPAARLASIEQVLDYPSVPEPLMRLALWISEYYYCSPASALSLVLPPGGLPALSRSTVNGKKVYSLKGPRVKPLSTQFVRLAGPGGGESMPGFRLTAARKRVLDLLADQSELPVSESMRLAGAGRQTIRSLAERGVLEIFLKEVHRDGLRYYGVTLEEGLGTAAGKASPDLPAGEEGHRRLILNKGQEQALAAITGRLDAADPTERSRPILVQGVAGAGKTEVYLRAIEAVTARGGGAIVLVPEISLTHQAVKRFRRRFGSSVGVLHSGLSLGERYDQYLRISNSDASVVIGPRSALFAPVPHLSLIIIDEENDASFKQENEPRYGARRVALERARLEGAALVLGSATPSLESYHLVKDRIVIPDRATGAPMPSVEIVDMRDESDHLFSGSLLGELDRNLSGGGKSILLLNSRGFARFLQCVPCGHVWKCKNCEVSLTIHSHAGRLLCHHCGYFEEMPGICPECQSSELRRWGVGTEQLEREVKRLFPEAAVFRLDADTSRGYGEGPRIIQAFERAGRAILVGTQMVAKGHHFPEVTLAAVINADLSLEFPEFRAEERTFSLLTQLAGRSGRAQRPGKVIIQTWNQDIECIRMAADQSLEEFYQAELGRRQRLGYPPYAELINILCLSRQSSKAGAAAAFLKEKLGPVLEDEKLLGPAELLKLKGWYRSHILLKTSKIEETLAVIKPVVEHFREPYRTRGVRIVVDVDPQWLS